MKKICVYAICKNESKFIDKWLDSMQEADYIVVLDTGSTDGTYERLQSDPRVTTVKQQVIDPWRFDVARNESLKLIPEDTDICVCTDFDELFDAGWGKLLRDNWIVGRHTLCWYKYAWRHDAQGNPIKIFRYEKIHTNDGWYWQYPVHEVLTKNNAIITQDNILDLFDHIYLHHYADDTKARGSYLPLLKIRKEEHPDELQTRVYLIQESFYKYETEECIKECLDALDTFKDMNSEIKSSIYLFLGDATMRLNQAEQAIEYYYKAIDADPEFTEQYVAIATHYLKQQQYAEVVDILTKCLKNAKKYYVWFTRGVPCDEFVIYDYLSVAYANIGDYDHAFVNIAKARFLKPDHPVVQTNYTAIEAQLKALLTAKTDNSVLRASSPY